MAGAGAVCLCGWKFQRREMLYVVSVLSVCLSLLAFGWFGYWFITDPHYRWVWYGWRESMREESVRHPVALANLKPYIIYLLHQCTVGFSFTFLFRTDTRVAQRRQLTPMLLLVAGCAFR